MNCYHVPIRMASKNKLIASAAEDTEQVGLWLTAEGDTEGNGAVTLENSLVASYKTNIRLPYNPTIPQSLVFTQKKWIFYVRTRTFPNVCNSFIHDHEKLKTLLISVNLWIHKNGGYPYSEILLSDEQEQATGTGNDMDESETHYAKWRKQLF